MLTYEIAGLGLNLATADTVILYDRYVLRATSGCLHTSNLTSVPLSVTGILRLIYKQVSYGFESLIVIPAPSKAFLCLVLQWIGHIVSGKRNL